MRGTRKIEHDIFLENSENTARKRIRYLVTLQKEEAEAALVKSNSNPEVAVRRSLNDFSMEHPLSIIGQGPT